MYGVLLLMVDLHLLTAKHLATPKMGNLTEIYASLSMYFYVIEVRRTVTAEQIIPRTPCTSTQYWYPVYSVYRQVIVTHCVFIIIVVFIITCYYFSIFSLFSFSPHCWKGLPKGG